MKCMHLLFPLSLSLTVTLSCCVCATLQHLSGCFCALSLSLIRKADIHPLQFLSHEQSATNTHGWLSIQIPKIKQKIDNGAKWVEKQQLGHYYAIGICTMIGAHQNAIHFLLKLKSWSFWGLFSSIIISLLSQPSMQVKFIFYQACNNCFNWI